MPTNADKPNGFVTVTIELPGAQSLHRETLGVGDPLSKLTMLRTGHSKWWVYNESTGGEITMLRPDFAANWDTPLEQFGVAPGSALSIWSRQLRSA
jgi:hypothetical protein